MSTYLQSPANAPQPRAHPGRAWRTKPPAPPTNADRTHKTRAGALDIQLARGPFAGTVLCSAKSLSELHALWKQFPLGQSLTVRNRITGFSFSANTSYTLPDEDIDYLIDGRQKANGDWYLDPHAPEVSTMSTTTNQIVPDITIYADGACSGNPGPAAYAAILVQGQPDAATCYQISKALAGAATVTKTNGRYAKIVAGDIGLASNNVAELHAILAALGYVLKPGSKIVVRTDSLNAIGWLSLGWKRKSPAIVDLAGQIDAMIADKHLVVTYEHVKGHSGDPLNDLADRKAQAAIKH